MENPMREDLMLTKKDFLQHLGLKTDKQTKRTSPRGGKRHRRPGTRKKVLNAVSAILCFALVFSLFSSISAFADYVVPPVASGYCGGEGDGTNLTWTLTGGGTLTVSGTGAMAAYTVSVSGGGTSPWYNDSRVKYLVVSPGVTTVSPMAFLGCSALRDAALPDTLTLLSASAFYNCDALKTVFFAGSEAQWNSILTDTQPVLIANFNDAPLKNADVRFNVAQWGYCGVSTGKNITWALTSDGVLTISGTGDLWAHRSSEIAMEIANTPWKPYRDSIRRVVIEEGVTSISLGAFSDCTALTSVSLPDSIDLFKPYAFSGCTALTGINIPEGVKSIPFDMFKGCTSLTHITLPESLTAIASDAFSKSGIADIVIPSHVTTIGQNAFYQCNGLAHIEIPESVTKIGSSAFRYCANLESVTFSEGLTEIESYAFGNCVSLREISLPDGMKTVGTGAFYECSGLTAVELPDTVTSLGSYAFYHCTSLQTAVLSENMQVISFYAFSGCKNLKSVNTPENTEYIYDNAFENCVSLTAFNIPSKVKVIRELAFLGTDSLRAFTVSEDNPWFSGGEYGCVYSKDKTTLVLYPGGRGAASFTVPVYVTGIAATAFAGEKALESVAFPASFTGNLSGAFYCCPNISSLTVDPQNPVYRCVNNCVIDPASKTLVLACKTSEIPDDGSVKRMGNSAYANTGRSITVPGFIEEFGENVYYGCEMLEAAVIAPGVTRTGVRMFPISVKNIVIPDTVTYIDSFLIRASVYGTLNSVDDFDVYYTGSEEQWNEIHIENWYEMLPNTNLIGASKHFDYRFTEAGGTPSTCAEPGYTEGLYCDVTGTWVSGHKALPLTDHTPGETVTENATAATCTSNGGYDEAVYCAECGTELSRAHITQNALPHTPGDPVTENVTAATCTSNGGYDEAVYCAVCDTELSRTRVQTPATGHVWGEWQVIKQATATEEGLMRRTCANDPNHFEEEIIPKLQPQTNAFQQFIQRIVEFFNNIIDWFRRLFRF